MEVPPTKYCSGCKAHHTLDKFDNSGRGVPRKTCRTYLKRQKKDRDRVNMLKLFYDTYPECANFKENKKGTFPVEVYEMSNIVDNKKYIGSTKNRAGVRFSGHLSTPCAKVKQHMEKIGKNKFKVRIIDTYYCTTEDERMNIEDNWIDFCDTISIGLNSRYNRCRTKYKDGQDRRNYREHQEVFLETKKQIELKAETLWKEFHAMDKRTKEATKKMREYHEYKAKHRLK